MNYKTLLKLDYGYTENKLLDYLETKVYLIKIGYTFAELFEVEYKRLKMEEEKYGI
ncbi:MAG: hypothetical protein JJO71_28945 [Escherichia coli]|nr:hypothetical protein [Escherichia coli]MBL1007664.1 hypothetical protein [Escherichia coli]